jgi:putative DNA-invertase from lambdoid prophage Rac
LPVADKLSGDGATADKRKGLGRTILYARVSTTDQTLTHQLVQAQASGFPLDEVVADHGVSGVGTRLADRPEGKRLFDLLRAGDTLVVRWVDRLGRNYRDVTDTIREFIRRGVIVRTVINGLTFDGATKDPMQQAVRDALIAFMAATAEAQAEASREAQKAGIAFAQSQRTNDALLRRYGSKVRRRWASEHHEAPRSACHARLSENLASHLRERFCPSNWGPIFDIRHSAHSFLVERYVATILPAVAVRTGGGDLEPLAVTFKVGSRITGLGNTTLWKSQKKVASS